MTTLRSSLTERQTHNLRLTAASTTSSPGGVFAAAGPILGAAYAATAGLQPTGHPTADIIWSALLGAAITLLASRANPALWMLSSALTVFATSNTALATGYGLAFVGLWSAYRFGLFRSSAFQNPAVGTVAGLFATPLLLGLGDLGYPGGSAAFAAIACILFAIVALYTSTRRVKRMLLPLALMTAFGLVLLGFAALSFLTSLRTHITDTENAAQASVVALRDGDVDGAIETVHRVEASLAQASDHFTRPTAKILRVLPVAGHNINALEEVVTASHDLVRTTVRIGSPTERLGSVFADGRIDPGQLEDLSSEMGELSSNLQNLRTAVSVDTSVWVAPPLASGIEELHSRLTPAFEGADTFDTIAAALPRWLGLETPRRYLVLFGNPAEARELGGFTGATAVLELDAGSFDLTTTGRRASTRTRATAAALSHAPPIRFLEHRPWRFEHNYSAMADFPTLTRALADIYPANGGQEIDGVIYLDPFALGAVAEITGPIDIASLGGSVAAEDLPELLLIQQYEQFQPGPERDTLFDQLFEGVAAGLQTGDFDLNADSARHIARVIEQDRLLFAPLDDAELAAADSLNLTGRIAPISSNDYLAVSHLNGGANKLDTYLERTIDYEVSLSADRRLTARVEVALHNNSPASLPSYAAGAVNNAPGTSRTTLVVHSPHERVSWEGLTEELELSRSFREFDRWRHEAVVIIDPGEVRNVTLNLAGVYEGTDEYLLDVGHQPLVTDDELTVSLHEAEQFTGSDTRTLTEDTTIRLPGGDK